MSQQIVPTVNAALTTSWRLKRGGGETIAKGIHPEREWRRHDAADLRHYDVTGHIRKYVDYGADVILMHQHHNWEDRS
jgi:hypothetical protein